jgi:hypothetical protein
MRGGNKKLLAEVEALYSAKACSDLMQEEQPTARGAGKGKTKCER